MKKRILSVIVALAMILSVTANLTVITASADGGSTVVRLDPSDASPFNNGEFQGWGTALCWWANRLGYSDALTQQAADAFFSEEGLGLDIARYNLGGGDDPSHTHISRSDSKVPGVWDEFELSADGKDVNITKYDITKDKNQLNIAKAALKANPDLYFEGFSNSAPYFMTITGCTSGGTQKTKSNGDLYSDENNLNDDFYDDFAKFIADATLLFKKEGIVFQSYSPMNEPDTTYWFDHSGKQEGCHFDPGESQSKMIVETRKALDDAGLNDVLVAGMDETSLKSTANNLGKLTSEAQEALGRVDTHTYSDRNYHAQVKAKARELNKNLWQSEVDNGGRAGTENSDIAWGLNLANYIVQDVNGMQPSAWVMWDIIDRHKDGTSYMAVPGEKDAWTTFDNSRRNSENKIDNDLWGVGFADHDSETLILTQKYYVYGQFTKYIEPGMTIIASSGNNLAAYDKKTGKIVIVAVNSTGSNQLTTFDLRAFTRTGAKAYPVRTSGSSETGEHWAELDPITVTDKQFDATLKANSVTTYVIEDEAATAVTKFDKSADGASYEYTVSPEHKAYDKYFAVYDGGALKAVTKNKTKGTLTGDFTNTTFKLLIWDGMEPVASVDTVTTKQDNSVDYMTIDGSTTIIAGVEYDYTAALGSSSEAPAVTWSVSDSETASVTQEGVVTAKKGGTFTLTATMADGVYTSIDITALGADQKIRIVNKKSGLGLETKSKSINSGSALVQWQDRQLDTAAWKLAPTSDGKFNIINANANYLLVNSDGLKISSEVEGTNDNAKWELKNHGGYYEIYNIGAQKSLNVSGQSTANGGSVILYTYGGGDNELWSFEAAADNLTHVVPVEVDYSDKYQGTDFTYVSNVESATNDFNDSELKGFVLSGEARLGSDSEGEAVLFPQGTLNNKASVNNSGTATLSLTNPITCADNQLINLSFDMYTPNSNGNSTFKLSSSDETELVDVTGTNWGKTYSVTIGGDEVESSGDGTVYFKNNQGDKDNNTRISNGGHVEVYYKPSTGAIRVTVKSVTNNSAVQTYTGVVDEGKDIKKIYFEGVYTSWNKQMAVDNLVTNIVTYSGTEFDDVEHPQATDAPVLPSSGELINLSFNDGTLASASTYGKATGSPKFVTVDEKQCIQFDGTSATVVTLTDANGNSLLTGQKNLTISFKVKPTTTDTSWWIYAAPSSASQTYRSEHYIGALTNGGKITAERYNSTTQDRPAQASGACAANTWSDVLISIGDDTTSVYVNGALIGSAASTVNVSDMLGKKSVAYIGLANWESGQYATGYLDDFVIYNYALDSVLASLNLGDTSAVTENIYLPQTIDGTAIAWSTSNENVVTNAGAITRADENQTATLTASVVVKGITLTKNFDVTVKGDTAVLNSFAAYAEDGSIKFSSEWTSDEKYDMAVNVTNSESQTVGTEVKNTAKGSIGASLANGVYKVKCTLLSGATEVKSVTRTVEIKTEQEMGAYLFAHFVGSESTADMEQIYFSVSEDGSTWQLLNGGQPVLKSTVGTTGVRDPYIMRTEDNKFVIIATDLSIYELNKTQGSNKWGYSVTNGSKNVVVWKSDSIDGWSGSTPNLREVAVSKAGCAWAPEAIYDPDEGKYMVFWASMVNGKHSIYRSYTTDFESFTEPELYIDNPTSTIDTTIIADKGVYYRFTKDETYKAINMMKCTSLSGEWEEMDSYTLNGKAGTSYIGYEGPTIYKLNNENKWCLLLDLYSSGKGYFPFVTSDLSSGMFTSPSDFTFPNGVTYRHGTVMPITTAEYQALLTAYPNN